MDGGATKRADEEETRVGGWGCVGRPGWGGEKRTRKREKEEEISWGTEENQINQNRRARKRIEARGQELRIGWQRLRVLRWHPKFNILWPWVLAAPHEFQFGDATQWYPLYIGGRVSESDRIQTFPSMQTWSFMKLCCVIYRHFAIYSVQTYLDGHGDLFQHDALDWNGLKLLVWWRVWPHFWHPKRSTDLQRQRFLLLTLSLTLIETLHSELHCTVSNESKGIQFSFNFL